MVEINPSYAEVLGPATASLISRDRPAPPVVFKTAFENSGNIDFPAYIILRITDESNQTIATLQSERQMVYPKQPNVFNVRWDNPPAEGNYRVEALGFGDVYEGLQLPGRTAEFDLRWLYVLLNLLLFIIALILLSIALYASHVLSRDIRDLRHGYRKAAEEFEGLIRYVIDVYHFRGRRKG